MKGFLVIAQNGAKDYVKLAYGLAMSLKLSQKKYNKLSVIVNENEEIPDKYTQLFDKVIPVEKPSEAWKVQNKWIEKSDFLLDTPQEKRKISVTKRRAQLRKPRTKSKKPKGRKKK